MNHILKLLLILLGGYLVLNSCKQSNLDSEFDSTQVKDKTLTERQSEFVELKNMLLEDLIWLGFQNPYELIHTSDKEFYIKETDDEIKKIEKTGNNRYSITIKKHRGFHRIEILNKVNSSVIEKVLTTKYLPNLIPSFGQLEGGKIGKKQLENYIVNNERVRVDALNYDVGASYTVLNFELVIFNRKGQPFVSKSDTNIFNNKQVRTLKELEIGDRFYIENITIKRSDGTLEKARIMSFELM